MRLSDFEAMVRRLSQAVPAHFFDGVAEVVVSPRSVPHPHRPDIFTLGECIPLPGGEGGGAAEVQSRVVLYHGSFMALAQMTPGFDWREEAWETLTHELRHHLEWRARAPDLENLDWAVEQNFARHDGEPFDPGFYLEGEHVDEGGWRVEDDVFLDRMVTAVPATIDFRWADRGYRVNTPPGATLPAFLTVDGVAEPPPGDLIVVLRRKPGILALLRPARVFQATLEAVEAPGHFPVPPAKGGPE